MAIGGHSDGRAPGADGILALLHAQPYRIFRPARQETPFVFASPHSGRLYPPSFVAKSRLSAINLRRSEDAFVDQLFAGVNGLGAPLIAAEFPRAYLDANRSPAELDAAMFDGGLSLNIDITSPRVSAGLGVIPRIVRDGAEIYREKLPPDEAEQRLAKLYRPYHAALQMLIDEARGKFGTAVVIDCHSMPSAAAAPDVVIGDRYGISASPALTRRAERVFGSRGFSIARNVPYAGGYTTHLYGRPAQGIHALQIEINRGLYLDEERILPSPRFAEIANRIRDCLEELVAMEPLLLRGTPRPSQLAAE